MRQRGTGRARSLNDWTHQEASAAVGSDAIIQDCHVEGPEEDQDEVARLVPRGLVAQNLHSQGSARTNPGLFTQHNVVKREVAAAEGPEAVTQETGLAGFRVVA